MSVSSASVESAVVVTSSLLVVVVWATTVVAKRNKTKANRSIERFIDSGWRRMLGDQWGSEREKVQGDEYRECGRERML